jgi:aryl-alcohol dehydrogenase-like predicted oxidoreductase
MMFQNALCLLLITSVVNGLSTVADAAKTVGNQAVPGLKNGMDYVHLGDSDLIVSKVCMGTMTFGEQNTLEEGVEQLNCAFDEYGVNFVDTAEIYPVPTKAESQGRTDQCINLFLKGRKRENVILATKVAGRMEMLKYLPRREPDTAGCLTKEQILDSVDASLKRLGTDYIDLLQIHWPDRYNGGLFGSPDFSISTYEEKHPDEKPPIPFEEQLAAMQELVQSGKVRYIGLSNETPYGVCSMTQLAKHFPELYPKIVSIQNSYSLVVRKDYEAGLAEACYHNKVGLLPYSPLAGGSLTGKYRADEKNKVPEKSRLTMFPGYMERYLGSQNEEAVNAYCEIAEKNGMTPTQLALSWCYRNDLVASTIIGATTMTQLEENLKAYDIRLNDAVQEQINQAYQKYTDPTKAKKTLTKKE